MILLDLDKQSEIIIQASIGNVREFEKIADAFIVQHPRIHLAEHKPKAFVLGKGEGKGKMKGKGIDLTSISFEENMVQERPRR